MADSSGTVDLADVLTALREGLFAAQEVDDARKTGLVVERAEIELSFTVEKAKGGGLGVKIAVFGVGLNAGGKKGSTSSDVQRMKLTLVPGPGRQRRAVASPKKAT